MKKKRKEVLENIEPAEDESLLPEQEPEDSDGILQEETGKEEYLTSREKFYVWTSVLASFVFFSILFLPYGIFTKKILNAIAKPIIIDYTELDYNIFEPNIVYDFLIDLSGNNIIKADQAGYEFSIFTFLRGGFNASAQLINPDLTFNGSSVKARTVNAEIKMDNINNPKISNGNIKFIASQMEIVKLNIRMIPIPLENINISGMKLSAVIKNGSVMLEGTRVKVDVFDVVASGNIQLNQSLNSSVLNLNICINPVPGSDFDSSGIFGMYLAAGGKMDSSMCFQVSGSPAGPSFTRL